jgi:PAS domain S-box-containing protein
MKRYWFNYGMAIASVAIALCLALLLEPVTSGIAPISLFYLSVIFSTWYGSLYPGIVATVLSVLAINYLFTPPIRSFNINAPGDFVRLVVFLIVAAAINLLSTNLHHSKQRIEKLNQQLQTENAEQMRMVLSSAQMGLWDWDLTTSGITWSPEHEILFGLAPGTFDGRYETVERSVHPDDRAAIAERVKATFKQRGKFEHEFRVIWSDGSIHWIEGRGKGFYDESGQPVRMAGTVIDITQRKLAELELEQTKETLEHQVQDRTAELLERSQRIEDLYNNAPCGYHSLDAAGRFVEINDTELRWLGYSREEILGRRFTEFLTPKGLEIFKANFPTFMETGAVNNLEFDVVCRDGSILPYNVNAVAIYDAAGNYVRSRSTLFDLRDRRAMEAALKTSELKFRLLSEESPNGVCMGNAQLNCMYTNPRMQEICGFTQPEASGRGWSNFVHPDDLPKLLDVDLLNNPEQVIDLGEVRFIHRDGTLRHTRLKISPIRLPNQDIGYVGTLEDITEQRKIEQMKTEFISIVSHELRTPLTAIRGSLGLLAAGLYEQKTDKGKRMIEVAAQQTDRLVRLVNDILDLQRLESNVLQLQFQICDPAKLIQQSIDVMQGQAIEQDIYLKSVVLADAVWANPDAIVQTLTNLISNAIKFSPAGSEIVISAELNPGMNVCMAAPPPYTHSYPQSVTLRSHVLFKIIDQGRGIPADKLQLIFERFQQVDASDSRLKGGTGLGLAICRKIIEQHHGQIWVESQLDQGSIFYFTLPYQDPHFERGDAAPSRHLSQN